MVMIVSCLFRFFCHVRSITATNTSIIITNILLVEDFEIYVKFFEVTDLSFSILERYRKQFYSISIHLLNAMEQHDKIIMVF